jgi:hypothetical protein
MASTRIMTVTATALIGVGGLGIFAWNRYQNLQSVSLPFTPLICPTTASVEKALNLSKGSIESISQQPEDLQIKLKSNARHAFDHVKQHRYLMAKLLEDKKIIEIPLNKSDDCKSIPARVDISLRKIFKECKAEVVSIEPANGLTYLITKDNTAINAIRCAMDKSGIVYHQEPEFIDVGEAKDSFTFESIYVGVKFSIRDTKQFNQLIEKENNSEHVRKYTL